MISAASCWSVALVYTWNGIKAAFKLCSHIVFCFKAGSDTVSNSTQASSEKQLKTNVHIFFVLSRDFITMRSFLVS